MDTAEDGFDDWFRATYPRAVAVAQRILGSRPEAEEAAAEAFTRAFASWDRVGPLPHRDGWVLRVASNVAIDAARRRRPEPMRVEATVDPDDATVLRLALGAALAALPRRQRQAVALRHLADLTPDEVAAAMGVSTNSVKKHLQRGLDRLRQTVPNQMGDGHVRT
jgi:RNA polymerase sigma-70 factor (ECF subfamily)